jgi:phosphate transport system substrate-binding protein
MMKKLISLLLLTVMVVGLLSGCTGENKAKDSSKNNGTFDSENEIVVVTREEGSGTRGAFVELFGIEEKAQDGTKIDKTTKEAITQMKTDTVLTTVAGNEYAIGYVSTGSLNDMVKAISIDGMAPTVENIKNGSYKIARPFNIATKDNLSKLAKDFIEFIMSSEGQKVVQENKYIAIEENASPYSGSKPSGKIVVAGSSSVTPLMEKLREAYLEINPNGEIEIQQSDSSSGMKAVIDGTADIGMASRELKDSESAELKSTAIALDGIAVIVNNENTVENLTKEDVRRIFIGEITKWSEINK